MIHSAARALLLSLAAYAPSDERVERLPQEHRNWIEKEVPYIIADREREAFLDLESAEERKAFIEAFWRRRDPDPLTPVNEFREEHYRRIEYANRRLGREAAVPGWMTDRGRIYITLGEPRDREEFTSVPFLYPAELWFYDAHRDKGLPPLYLLFFQEYHAGPYRLFNHLLDGPEDLMPLQPLDSVDSRRAAYEILQQVNPGLAHATITMRADQGAAAGILQPDRSALDFQSLIADIYSSPSRRVDTRYLDAAKDAKGFVESEYLFNYVPSAALAHVLPGPSGTSFVHYAVEIEPQHMTLARDPEKDVYYTSFELKGEVTTPDESTVVA
ncbi:MAG: GWxTD domain-containing protein, partial [Vicinamibacteria bacterium]